MRQRLPQHSPHKARKNRSHFNILTSGEAPRSDRQDTPSARRTWAETKTSVDLPSFLPSFLQKAVERQSTRLCRGECADPACSSGHSAVLRSRLPGVAGAPAVT